MEAPPQKRPFAIRVRTFFKLTRTYKTVRNSLHSKMSTTRNTTTTTAPTVAPDTSRARLLEAIEEASFEPTAQETLIGQHTQVGRRGDTWWNHIVATFFIGDEARMFRELRINRVVFEEIVNTVADLPLQRRGRRAFIFSHEELEMRSSRPHGRVFPMLPCERRPRSPCSIVVKSFILTM